MSAGAGESGSLERLLDQVPLLRARTSVEPLDGGLTNTNLKVEVPGATYVVRLSGPGTDLLLIDRDAEHVNTRRAHEAGVGPPVHEYRPDVGLLVIGFVDGRTLADRDFTRPDVLERAARACRLLHEGPRFEGGLDMFARQAAYRRTVHERGFDLPATYDDHERAWARVVHALGPRSTWPVAPCNNDLLAGNFIDDGERVSLIDYEYAGDNDPSFELGNTCTECDLPPEAVEAYVEAYHGRLEARALARVRLQMLCSEYGWALWGFIQAGVAAGGDGPADEFDYTAWGIERFEKAARTFTSSGFDRLLDQVGGR